MNTQDLQTPRLLALGDAAWTVEFGQIINADINARVMGLADKISSIRKANPLIAAVTDVVPTFRSLTVHFNPQEAEADVLGAQLLALANEGNQQAQEGRHWLLPVCFDSAFAPDLPRLAEAKAMSEAAVIERLLATEFRVYMIGFLPGFPYMGGLPPELAMPRLASPRQRVPAQSLAVAGEMCAVYPWESPGGWNLLGRTPVQLFDLRHVSQPAMLAAGDWVRWHAVDVAEYERLLTKCQNGQLARETFLQAEGAK
jgi:KipI family sensor histidine kinase inhibitor